MRVEKYTLNTIISLFLLKGKTSLKKTLFGEPFNPEEGPTKCIAADPSLARIQFRQYREWIIQPTSKADAHRLNLEYNDAIIDFILNEIRKPGVADEIVDLKKLGLRKQLKTVEFQPTPYLIPSLSISMDRHALLSCEEEGGKGEGEEEKRSFLNSDSNNSDSSTVSSEEREEEEEEEQDEESHFRGRQGTIVNLKKNKGEDDLTNDEEQQQQQNPPSLTQITPRTAPSNERLKSKLTVFDSTFEMSKDLMEHIPLEVLKRLVMRWPVDGEENVMDQESLGFRRLLIHVWDCSGDPLQLSVVPLFFSSRSIYLMTYDVRNSINDPATSFLTHKLTNSKGSPPTNGEVLNEWLGGVLAQSKHLPSNPQPVSRISPQLPPLIFVTPFSDMSTRYSFQDFFKPSPSSPQSFLHHMIEPNFVSVSNHDETKMISEYRSHYYLRREIDYLARQMPYIYDMVPVQWVMFEQLLHSLLEQKKVIIQLTDLERYVAENCDIIGPLQVQPVLSYYNDVGRIIHFHRHPALSPLIVIRPQWLLDALGSIFNSSSTTWITNEVRNSFQCLASEGHIRRDVLLLAYRCSHLPQYFWNETLYFMNYMDLSACHTSLHETAGLYIPALVTQTPPSFAFGPTGDDPETLFFSCGKSLCPLSLFNQLVVRCIRTCRYPPVMYYGIVHLRLNSTHHLILRRDGNRVGVLVQRDTEHFCRNCPTGQTSFETTRECEHLTHLIDYEKETTPSVSGGGGGVEMDKSFLNELPNISLSLSDDLNQLEQVCPIVLKFLEETFEFLIRCWYPGLLLELTTEGGVVINQRWRKRNSTESTERTNDDRKLKKLSLWFL